MQPQYITLSKRATDITGQRFGCLIALGPIGRKNGAIEWLCACDCGNTATVSVRLLRNGSTKSCGCVAKQLSSVRLTTHGKSRSKIHWIWAGMIQRCGNPNNKNYADYGGRGIRVCDEWKNSFAVFHAYVSGLPNFDSENMTLDRIDNNMGYSPDNVRWLPRVQQMRNTRKNVLLTHNGKAQCVSAWAEELEIQSSTLSWRVRAGWSTERVLTTPARMAK